MVSVIRCSPPPAGVAQPAGWSVVSAVLTSMISWTKAPVATSNWSRTRNPRSSFRQVGLPYRSKNCVVLRRADDRPSGGLRLHGDRAGEPGVGDARGDPPKLVRIDRDVVGENREGCEKVDRQRGVGEPEELLLPEELDGPELDELPWAV